MPILNSELLLDYNAVLKQYEKNEFVFHEGEKPRYLYFVDSGQVKMFSVTEEGKEFTQGNFHAGDTFGEPVVFIGESYPASAKAMTKSKVMQILKRDFFHLLEENPAIQMKFLTLFAQRVYDKSMAARELISHSPELRIVAYLNNYRKKHSPDGKPVEIKVTRKEIADLTGLCVETVIRTVSKMKDRKQLMIVNRKIIY